MLSPCLQPADTRMRCSRWYSWLSKSLMLSGPILLTLGLILLATPAWATATLAEALDLAWERAVSAKISEAKRTEAEANRVVGGSVFAAPPVLGIALRDDRLNSNRGLREYEVDVALPLWLPGQRDARRVLAEQQWKDSDAAMGVARLALAGELRAAVWALSAAEAETAIARERVTLAEKLQADVARRESAGDLARTDLLLAKEDMLTAKAALVDSHTRQRQALERYRLLTGREALPAKINEDIQQADERPVTESLHPRIRLAKAGGDLARAEMQLARESRRDAPELAIGWKQSREDSAASVGQSISLGMRMPFATEARNAPRIAAANTRLIRAEAEYRQVVAELESERREAANVLESTLLSMQSNEQRATLAAERLRHLQRAFDLGELSLHELVRVRSAATAAQLDAARARLAHAAARSQFNQAQGVLP